MIGVVVCAVSIAAAFSSVGVLMVAQARLSRLAEPAGAVAGLVGREVPVSAPPPIEVELPERFQPSGGGRPPRAGRRRWGVTLAGLAASVVLIGFGGGIGAMLGSSGAAPISTARTATTAAAEPTDGETAEPTMAGSPLSGLVDTAPSVRDDRAAAVAAMFDTYFAAINAKDFETVASVLDPAGAVDTGNATQMTALAQGLSTVTDSNVVLRAVTGPSAFPQATVTFRSHQGAGHGPPGRTAETCTDWSILYTLSYQESAGYRIFRSDDASHTSC
jgi:hypothetical protein